MYSLSRAFFFSLGTILFLVLSLFWVGLALDFSALENFIVKLSYATFVGYTIPQILGSHCDDTVVDQVFRLKIICSFTVIFYGTTMLSISNLKTKKAKFLWLYYSIVVPLLIVLSLIWFKIIYDDHILSQADKIELSQFTIFAFVTSLILILLIVRKERPKLPESVAAKLPTVDELKSEIKDFSNGKTDSVDSSIEQQSSNEKHAVPPTENKAKPKNKEAKDLENNDEVEKADAKVSNEKTTKEAPKAAKKQEKKEEENGDDLSPPAVDELPPELAELRKQSESDEMPMPTSENVTPEKQGDEK